jgi:hypothetical protein
MYLWYDYFNRASFDASFTAPPSVLMKQSFGVKDKPIELFFDLIDKTLRDCCRQLSDDASSILHTQYIRDLETTVFRLIPTRVFCLSQGHGIKYQQLRNHYRLVITIAKATLPILQDQFAGLMDSFLRYEESDAAARRICVESFGALAHIYMNMRLHPSGVIDYLCQFLKIEDNILKKSTQERSGKSVVPTMFERQLSRDISRGTANAPHHQELAKTGWMFTSDVEKQEAITRQQMDVIEMLIFEYITLFDMRCTREFSSIHDLDPFIDEGRYWINFVR